MGRVMGRGFVETVWLARDMPLGHGKRGEKDIKVSKGYDIYTLVRKTDQVQQPGIAIQNTRSNLALQPKV
jgi:hypothetical protein